MEHVVFYPGPDSAPAFRRFATLDEAVRFVEHLRNVEGVAEVSLHALTPVPVAFRAYYRVEVPAGEVAVDVPEQHMPMPAAEPVPPQPAVVEAVVEPVVEPAVVEPEPEPEVDGPTAEVVPLEPIGVEGGASNGKRSMGFFAR